MQVGRMLFCWLVFGSTKQKTIGSFRLFMLIAFLNTCVLQHPLHYVDKEEERKEEKKEKKKRKKERKKERKKNNMNKLKLYYIFVFFSYDNDCALFIL